MYNIITLYNTVGRVAIDENLATLITITTYDNIIFPSVLCTRIERDPRKPFVREFSAETHDTIYIQGELVRARAYTEMG